MASRTAFRARRAHRAGKVETFSAARARLLSELSARGWATKPNLKVPQAISPDRDLHLDFHGQAVYLHGGNSLHLDIRNATVERLLDSALYFTHAAKEHRAGSRVPKGHLGADARDMKRIRRDARDIKHTLRRMEARDAMERMRARARAHRSGPNLGYPDIRDASFGSLFVYPDALPKASIEAHHKSGSYLDAVDGNVPTMFLVYRYPGGQKTFAGASKTFRNAQQIAAGIDPHSKAVARAALGRAQASAHRAGARRDHAGFFAKLDKTYDKASAKTSTFFGNVSHGRHPERAKLRKAIGPKGSRRSR
jgi:hypothetical protein